VVAFAWNIVRFAVCETCGLGPDDGLGHLCRGRWAAVRRAAIPVMDGDAFPRRRRLERLSANALTKLGRLPFPLFRRGDAEFLQLTWEDATKLTAQRLAEGGRLLEQRPASVECRWVLDQLSAALAPGAATLTLGSVATDAPFRAHVVELLEPQLVMPASDEVLLLPALSRYSQTGGAVWRGPDDVLRFSPEIRGNPVPDGRPDWAILHRIWDALRGAPPTDLDADAMRVAIGSAEASLAGLADLRKPGSRLHLTSRAGQ
jgi:hypothetical protein